MCWFVGLGLSLAIPTSHKPFLFTIYGTHLLGTPGWVVAPHFWELGTLQGVLGRATRSPQSQHRLRAIWVCISSSSSSTEPAKGQPPRQTRRRSAQHRGRSSPCLRPRRAAVDAGVPETKATELHRTRTVPGAPLGGPPVPRSSQECLPESATSPNPTPIGRVDWTRELGMA